MPGLAQLDRRRAEDFVRRWERLFDGGDYRTMAGYYAEDARLVATQHPTVEGRMAIEHFWRTACHGASAAGVTRRVYLDDLVVSGDLGYMRGFVTIGRGDAPDVTVRYVTVWMRRADGVWRLVEDISTPAPNGR